MVSTKKMKSYFRGNNISPVSNIVLNASFFLYSFLCLAPIVLVIAVSFTDEKSLARNGFSFIPRMLSLGAYEFLLADWRSVARSYAITVYATIVGTFLAVLVTSMFAYVVSRKDFKYRNHLAFFMFFTMLFNGGLVPWYMLYTQYLHLKDNLLVFIIPTLFSAYNMLIVRTYFKNNVADSLIESAKIDGAGEYTIFFKIVVPISKPVFATISLFVGLYIWNDWYISLLYINSAELINLQYLMYKTMVNIQSLQSHITDIPNAAEMIAKMPNQSLRMAMAVVGIGPIVLAYPFLQKYFIKGLTIGAVKG